MNAAPRRFERADPSYRSSIPRKAGATDSGASTQLQLKVEHSSGLSTEIWVLVSRHLHDKSDAEEFIGLNFAKSWRGGKRGRGPTRVDTSVSSEASLSLSGAQGLTSSLVPPAVELDRQSFPPRSPLSRSLLLPPLIDSHQQYRFNSNPDTNVYDVFLSYRGAAVEPRFTLRAFSDVPVELMDGPPPLPYSKSVS